ncbi:hypothetical protein ACFQ0M_02715 [Kitasatospora aburaviensis]
MSTAPATGSSRYLVLAAMIFAVAMTFIDQTIVSIAVPNIQQELDLTSTGCSGWSTPTCSPWRRSSPSAAGSPTRSVTAGW